MLKFVAKTGLPVDPQQSPSCDDSAPQSVVKRPRLVVPESSSTADFSMIDGVNDIASNLCEPPSQPILKEYPKRVFGSRTRCLNKEWYKERPWLEYSVSSDSVFCYCCRAFPNFSTSDSGLKLDLEIGMELWKRIRGSSYMMLSSLTSQTFLSLAVTKRVCGVVISLLKSLQSRDKISLITAIT